MHRNRAGHAHLLCGVSPHVLRFQCTGTLTSRILPCIVAAASRGRHRSSVPALALSLLALMRRSITIPAPIISTAAQGRPRPGTMLLNSSGLASKSNYRPSPRRPERSLGVPAGKPPYKAPNQPPGSAPTGDWSARASEFLARVIRWTPSTNAEPVAQRAIPAPKHARSALSPTRYVTAVGPAAGSGAAGRKVIRQHYALG
jgi:hypothetical protein